MTGEKKNKRRADLALIGALLLMSGFLSLRLALTRKQGGQAVLYVDGVRSAAYPLEEDTVIRWETVDGESFNQLEIRDGAADMTDAGCPDLLCVHMRPIRYAGESIICLPNRLEVRIEENDPGEVDIRLP